MNAARKPFDRHNIISVINNFLRNASRCLVSHDPNAWQFFPYEIQAQRVDEQGCVWLMEDEGTPFKYNRGSMEIFYFIKNPLQFLTLVGEYSGFENKLLLPQSVLDVKLVRFVPEQAFYWNNDTRRIESLYLH